MTVVVLYLCFYCVSSGESACKSDSQAREPAAVTCPSFIASATLITVLWVFSHVGLCFTPKKWIKSAFFLCASLNVCHSKLEDPVRALWGLHITAMACLVNFCRTWEFPFGQTEHVHVQKINLICIEKLHIVLYTFVWSIHHSSSLKIWFYHIKMTIQVCYLWINQKCFNFNFFKFYFN